MGKIIRMLFITLVLTSCAVEKSNQSDISPELQNKMGVMYAKGLGVEVDYHKAFEFYMKSALRNYAQAQNNVAFCYVSGQGVKKIIQKRCSGI